LLFLISSLPPSLPSVFLPSLPSPIFLLEMELRAFQQMFYP
jgi:hypothetical protein